MLLNDKRNRFARVWIVKIGPSISLVRYAPIKYSSVMNFCFFLILMRRQWRIGRENHFGKGQDNNNNWQRHQIRTTRANSIVVVVRCCWLRSFIVALSKWLKPTGRNDLFRFSTENMKKIRCLIVYLCLALVWIREISSGVIRVIGTTRCQWVERTDSGF